MLQKRNDKDYFCIFPDAPNGNVIKSFNLFCHGWKDIHSGNNVDCSSSAQGASFAVSSVLCVP